jgi:hypothetical protein
MTPSSDSGHVALLQQLHFLTSKPSCCQNPCQVLAAAMQPVAARSTYKAQHTHTHKATCLEAKPPDHILLLTCHIRAAPQHAGCNAGSAKGFAMGGSSQQQRQARRLSCHLGILPFALLAPNSLTSRRRHTGAAKRVAGAQRQKAATTAAREYAVSWSPHKLTHCMTHWTRSTTSPECLP